MSITPQAIERSVLEGKDRDELTAIAQAMGTKPASRASKATLIDQILRQAGIGVEGEPEAQARPANGAEAGDGSSEPARNGADGSGAAGEARAGRTEREPRQGSEAGAADAVPGEAAKGDGAKAGEGKGGETKAGDGAAGDGTAGQPRGGEAQGSESRGGDGKGGDGKGGDQGQQQGRNRDAGRRGNDRNRNQGQSGDRVAEPGNRRTRRRRGRDRSERDLQGGAEAGFQGDPTEIEGLLDLREEGYGFLRMKGYRASNADVYVSLSQVRRFALRKGDYLEGASRPAASNEKYPALLRIDAVNGMTPDEARARPKFESLTPLFPDENLHLEIAGEPQNMIARIIDLVSPIGKGQRGMIVSPPKAGKTTVLKQIAHSIEANNPEVHLMVLLVDERPEEVTDFRRSVKGEVMASTFDRPSDEHAQVAELTLERAKRLVELGRDVVIVLDGITRLARAYNLAAPATGRIMSGGIDVGALYPPKKFFGAARNIEEGGSLTILATALVETGSKMDEVIFEEFKGTGNMELKLDRKLSERRIYPALDVNASSTRHEELLFDRGELQQVWKLRRVLNALEAGAGLELLMEKIRSTKSNDEFLAEIAKAPAPTT